MKSVCQDIIYLSRLAERKSCFGAPSSSDNRQDMTQVLSIDNVQEILNNINNIGDLRRYFQVLSASKNYSTELLSLIFNNRKNQIEAPMLMARGIEEADIEMVRDAIGFGADVNGSEYVIPLFEAARNGYLAISRLLLENGANPNATQFNSGYLTALAVATQNQNIEIVRLLLANGANKTIPDEIGRTPSQFLAMKVETGQAEPIDYEIAALLNA
jgi:hypothetical protein